MHGLFRTGVVLDDVEMEVVFDPVKIRQMYIKTWFAIDLASSIPWDIIIGLVQSDDADDASRHVKFVRFLKVLTIMKLLRVTRLAKAIRNWEELLNFQYNISNEATMKILQIVLMLLTVIHINGCLNFMVPMFMEFPEADEGNIKGPCWVVLRDLKDADPTIQYSWSIFKVSLCLLGWKLSRFRRLLICFVLDTAKLHHSASLT